MRVRTWMAAAAIAQAIACGGTPTPPPGAPAESADVAAPYPYTVAQIRAGCPFGRSIEYRIEKAGSPPVVQRWSFQPEGSDAVKVTTESFDAEGNSSGPPETSTAKWAELHEHARFPHAATTIANETISLPAGTFDSMHYVVTQGDEVRSYWFARSLPGPPVKLEIVKGGAPVMTMTMQANRTH